MKSTLTISLPGQPALPGEGPQTARPPGSAETAIAAVAALAEREGETRLFGFLSPRLTARFDEASQELLVVVDAALTVRGSQAAWIDWKWGRLWQNAGSDAWGWHPSAQFLALRPTWRRQLFDAINPGMAHDPRRS